MVGSHLADYILEHHPGVEVNGLIRWRSPMENIQHHLSRIRLHEAELRDLNSLVQVLGVIKPDWIFHLAAQSYVSASFLSPADTLHTNIIGTTNLLDAVRIVRISPKIHICSSSEVYGHVLPGEFPIRESNPFRPLSPYAVSKVGEDMIAQQYFHSYGLQIVRTRMFTHTGPRRGDVFAASAFAKQIAEVEAGVRKNPIKVGNLESVRTFQDVRDAVKAYWVLMEKCPAGEVYNIGGEWTVTVGRVLEILKSYAVCPIEHEVDAQLFRPSDVTMQIPDVSKFHEATGWKAEIPIEDTLRDLLEYHRKKVRRNHGL